MAAAKKRRWVWTGGSLTALVLITLTIYAKLHQQAPARLAVAVQGTIQAYIEERGQTSLPHIYHLTMPMQGRVLPMTVQEGDQVKAGALVARLDDADWQDATQETRDIIKAVAKWVEAARAEVKASEIRRDYTQWEWQADQKLLKTRSISEKQERESRHLYLDAAVKIEESQAMLHMSESLQSIMDLLPGYVQRNLERTLVKSPVSGTILKRHVWNERVMTPGEPLLDIGNLEELEIAAEILTEDAVRIEPGDPVEIFGGAVGEARIAGRVRLVEPEAFTKISSLGVEEQRVRVKIVFTSQGMESLARSGQGLGLNYRVRVRIITAQKPKVILVPRTALFHGSKGQWQLYTVVAGRARLRTVQVGLINDFKAEIVAGVQLGETVVMAPESSISDGTRVMAMK
ncbi:efflux RND transporter periplasmic adaptor subunit [Desulfogranum mediterraneum]|uniref:efflux RND transporter periplasmic adaptor subunit n=1 Tax=Desulfogranum mediterraneum TaxID=160661 RepID=UPI00041CFA72|nr:efflux RND transporter periplasmic adaptor subunit [Desulfogranum mediterraneum]